MEVIVLLQEATYLKPRAKSSRPPSAAIPFLPIPVKAAVDRDLTVADLRVLAFFKCLARRRSKRGEREVTVSLSTIVQKTGLSRKQVRETMARLKSKGFITKQEGGKGNIASYRLNQEKPFVYIPAPVFNLSPSAVKVYAYLRWLQGRKDLAFPRVRTIAADLGLTIRSVLRALRALEAAGWIRTEGTYTHAYRVALRMPFSVEKAVPVEATKDNFPGPSAEMAMPTQDSPNGVGYQLSPIPSPEERGAGCHLPGRPAVIFLGGQLSQCSPLQDAAETQTETEQTSTEHLAPHRIETYETRDRDERGLKEASLQLGGKANFETPSFGREAKPSITSPLPQENPPSACVSQATPSPRPFACSKAKGSSYDVQAHAAALREALAEAESLLAAKQKERARTSGHRVEDLDREIQALKVDVSGYRRKLAELEGSIGQGLLGTPDDFPVQ